MDAGKGMQSANSEDQGRDWVGAFGVGLRGMIERMRPLGGELDVTSAEDGTTVTASIPLPNREPLE
jgi:signal transduction histidine kinase